MNINVMDDVDLSLISEIESKCLNQQELDEKEVFYLLSYVSYKVRDLLSKYQGVDIKENDYKNMCNRAQAMIGYYFDKLGVSYHAVQTNKIFSNIVGHWFVVVSFNDKDYLIDPTYNQFFDKNGCRENRFYIQNGVVLSTPYPGYFISKLPVDEQEIAERLLFFGFMELNPTSAKVYGDSLYKTQTHISKKEHDILEASGNSYIQFFKMFNVELNKTQQQLQDDGLLLNPLVDLKKYTK